jgi:hypothetical protein
LGQPNYTEIIGDFRAAELGDAIRTLSSGSRLGGPRGESLAWLKGPKGLGQLGEVIEEPFAVTIPDPASRGTLTIRGKKIEVHPLWPNGVRTNTCDVDAQVVYAGKGTTAEFDGKPIRGAIAVLEFQSEQGWNNAARLGARAIVFIEPEKADRGEMETKWSEIPLDIPRFWVSREHASFLRSAGGRAALTCRQNWVDFKTANYMAALRSNDPEMGDEWIIVAAYSDGSSGVPGLAPAADQSASLAALCELVRHFKANPPKRSVLFLATSAHFQGKQGMRTYIEDRFKKGWDGTGG